MILPFFVPDIYQGFATANGIAQLNSVGLQLELEVKEHWFGRSRCSIIEMRIPYCEISNVIIEIELVCDPTYYSDLPHRNSEPISGTRKWQD